MCRPHSVPEVGPGGAPKGASPGLGRGLNAIFCLVRVHCVWENALQGKQGWQCNVVLAVWRRYELRLLKLLEVFSFVDTFVGFNAAEQRQHGQQGRVNQPNVHSSGKLKCFLAGCFPRRAAPYAGPGDKPSLGRGAYVVSLQLVFPYCRP